MHERSSCSFAAFRWPPMSFFGRVCMLARFELCEQHSENRTDKIVTILCVRVYCVAHFMVYAVRIRYNL